MGKYVIRDAQIVVDGTDLKSRSNTVAVNREDDEQEATAFGAGARQRLKGIPDANISVTFFQDFEAGSTHSNLGPLAETHTPFPVYVVPTEGTVSETNPAFVLEEALLFGYNPVDGSVGEISTIDVTFQNAGDAGLKEITNPAELPGS